MAIYLLFCIFIPFDARALGFRRQSAETGLPECNKNAQNDFGEKYYLIKK